MLTLNLLASRAFSGHRLLRTIARSGLPLFAALFAAGVPALKADTISSNLTDISAGTETATGSTWLTASFGTGTSSWALETVTLRLANSIAGTAEVDLYTDGLLEPGSLVAQLTSPAAYSTTLAETSFSVNGPTLAANSTYWIVLKAASGAFDWSWTAENTGTGVGYQGTWGTSSDGGITWFTYAVYPTQLSVTTSSASVAPEPSSRLLSGFGFAVGGVLLSKKRKFCGLMQGQRR